MSELVHTKFFKLGTGNSAVEIFTFSKSFALNFSLMGRRKNTLGLFALGAETAGRAGVVLDIEAGLLLKVSHAVFNKAIIEIFTTQVSVTIGGLNLENTAFNFQEEDIKSTTSKIEDKNVAFTLALLVKTVGNSSSGGLIDDTLDLKTSNGAGILGSLTLRVIEVSGNCNNSLLDNFTEIIFSSFLNLDEDQGRNFFRLELLLFSLELDNNDGLASSCFSFNSERP